jgi:hypothetical protein
MIKLQEVYKRVSVGNPMKRYTTRDIFINPKHIRSIRDSGPVLQTISESVVDGIDNARKEFCVLSMEKEDIVVVGSLKEIENKVVGGKVLLNG